MVAPHLTPDGCLTELLEQWRADIMSVPIPRLVDSATAVALIRSGKDRVATAPDEVSLRRSRFRRRPGTL